MNFVKYPSEKQKEKPTEDQRANVVLGRIELPTHGFSVHCSTI